MAWLRTAQVIRVVFGPWPDVALPQQADTGGSSPSAEVRRRLLGGLSVSPIPLIPLPRSGLVQCRLRDIQISFRQELHLSMNVIKFFYDEIT